VTVAEAPVIDPPAVLLVGTVAVKVIVLFAEISPVFI
jgi:hypothetical protein